ncbi:secondary thiamine-phosphate synthase enzyme YjbQ [Moorella naiadis]|uniref:secondary thiamine-phosphate synthase enzyme YjbQ n=1 Tax=Moorella naiadis (nom. illeg.) TaxID=3093670 RepID=UPI003D9CB279
MFFSFDLQTQNQTALIDITHLAVKAVQQAGIKDGLCLVYIPHTTAGVTINENADPDVVTDILAALDKIVPAGGYRHREGNSPAHIKASLMGSSQTVIVRKGNLVLGTWQGIYFCEFDGPRRRKIHIKVWQTGA